MSFTVYLTLALFLVSNLRCGSALQISNTSLVPTLIESKSIKDEAPPLQQETDAERSSASNDVSNFGDKGDHTAAVNNTIHEENDENSKPKTLENRISNKKVNLLGKTPNTKQTNTDTYRVETEQEKTQHDRVDLDRAIDISRYVSKEFHNKNNVYVLPTNTNNDNDSEKYVSSEFDLHTHHSPESFSDHYRQFQNDLTTPKTPFFDTKYKEAVKSIDQTLEHIDDSSDSLSDLTESNFHDVSVDDLLEETRKNNTNATLNYVEYKNLLNNNTLEKNNSRNHLLEVEKGKSLDFHQAYNETEIIDEETSQDIGHIDNHNYTSETSTLLNEIIYTTKKVLDSTKTPFYTQNNSILNNNIETGNSNSDDPITNVDKNNLDDSYAKKKILERRGSVKYSDTTSPNTTPQTTTSTTTKIDIVSEQSVQENQIISIHVEPPIAKTLSTELILNNVTESSSENKTESTTEFNISTTLKSPETTTIQDTTNETIIIPNQINITETLVTAPNLSESKLPSEFSTEINLVNLTTNIPESTSELTIRSSKNIDFNNDSTTTPVTTSLGTTTLSWPPTIDVMNKTLNSENSTTSRSNENSIIHTSEATTTEIIQDFNPTISTTSETVSNISVSTITESSTESETIATEVSTMKLNINESTITSTTFDDLTTGFTTTEEIYFKSSEFVTDTSTSSTLESYEGTTEIVSTTIESVESIKPNFTVITSSSSSTISSILNTTSTEAGNTSTESFNTNATFIRPFINGTTPISITPGSVETSTVNSSQNSTTKIVADDLSTSTEYVFIQIKNNQGTSEPNHSQTFQNNAGASEPDSTTQLLIETSENVGMIGSENPNSGPGSGTIAAITISTIGAVCLILLAILLFVMRKRQKRFNYGQRCKPVSLDDYSMDNVSVYNSVRRKGNLRHSKRSHGNPAFEDPVSVTHPLNLAALAKFSTNLEDIEAEFAEIPQITAHTNELPEGCDTKNRYANVIPLPESRVYLTQIDGYDNSDYINANFVTGPQNTKKCYIACQAPMQNTVDDFWRMVWEQESRVILMLTHLFENGMEKCVDYLPPSEVLDCHRLFGDFQVTLKKREVKNKYIISILQLKNMVSSSWREVTHLWYLDWPEKGVPSEVNPLIAYLIEARSYMKASIDRRDITNGNLNNGNARRDTMSPVVVHCSPGTGRTGTVIACDFGIREFEKTRLVDIPKIVYRIRRDRASAVQTKEQYEFIYKVISLYAAKLTGGVLDSNS